MLSFTTSKASSLLRHTALHHHHHYRPCITAAITTVFRTLHSHTASTSSSSSTSTSTYLMNSLSFAAPEESEAAYIQSMLPSSKQEVDHYHSTTAAIHRIHSHQPPTSSSSSSSSTWLLNSLSFAAPEESEAAYIQSMLPNKYHNLIRNMNFSNVPQPQLIRTLQDVLLSNQACIVTTLTQPHTIVAVNDTWTSVCGYTQEEVHHKSISDILHGPLTNDSIIAATMQRVQENIVHDTTDTPPATVTEDMYVVNYKKDHTSFINHVTMSKIILSEDQPHIQFLLGIVQPTTSVPLRMVL